MRALICRVRLSIWQLEAMLGARTVSGDYAKVHDLAVPVLSQEQRARVVRRDGKPALKRWLANAELLAPTCSSPIFSNRLLPTPGFTASMADATTTGH